MLSLPSESAPLHRGGPSRRAFLNAGAVGLAGLTLPNLLAARAASRAAPKAKSCIVVWLDGGPSHLESWDPKPDAPKEIRGPFAPIKTTVPGTLFCELLPKQAALAKHLSVIRSMHHDTGDHFAGGHWMLTGRAGSNSVNQTPQFPSLGSYISRLRGPNKKGFPAYVGLPAAQSIYLFPGYAGAAYLGGGYNPFDVDREQSYLHHASKAVPRTPRALASGPEMTHDRTKGRGDLLGRLDAAKRKTDKASLGKFQSQALDMVLSPSVARAFDASKEDPRLVDRYGDNPWGRYTLLARRLVEAGVTLAHVDMPHWDHHSSLVEGHAPNMRAMDRAVGALLEDLIDRGMLDETLVVVMGEFGRTPVVNKGQPGIPIPGRDHWGNVFSLMVAGGGIKPGVVVGSSNAKAEVPADRAVKPHDLFATLYGVLGIDPDTSFDDATGRPVPILGEGKAIKELLA